MNSIENIERLQAVGFPQAQAQAIAKVVENTIQETTHNLTTKEDLALLEERVNTKFAELKGEIDALRVELKGDMNTLRVELKGEMSDKITSQTRWLMGTIITSQAAMAAILALVITLT